MRENNEVKQLLPARPNSVGPIDKRSIKILTSGINGNLPFVYSSVSRTYILL